VSQYFTRTFRVDWSEANANGKVHLPTYFRYLIETAWSWGAAVGLGIEDCQKMGMAWVVRETQIKFFQALYPEDEFELTFWLAHWRRVHGTRYFELVHKASGAVVAQGAQEVVTLNMQTMRPMSVSNDIVQRLTIDNPRAVPHQPFPVSGLQRGHAFTTQRTVTWQDLDSLEHVNNTNYVAYAEDAVVTALADCGWEPKTFKASGLAVRNDHVHIQYLVPAAWGETLNIHTLLAALTPEGGLWYVDIERAADHEPIARCAIAWSVARTSDDIGEILPETLFRALKARLSPEE